MRAQESFEDFRSEVVSNIEELDHELRRIREGTSAACCATVDSISRTYKRLRALNVRMANAAYRFIPAPGRSGVVFGWSVPPNDSDKVDPRLQGGDPKPAPLPHEPTHVAVTTEVEVITFTELPAGKAISRSEVKVLAPTTPMETR